MQVSAWPWAVPPARLPLSLGHRRGHEDLVPEPDAACNGAAAHVVRAVGCQHRACMERGTLLGTVAAVRLPPRLGACHSCAVLSSTPTSVQANVVLRQSSSKATGGAGGG